KQTAETNKIKKYNENNPFTHILAAVAITKAIITLYALISLYKFTFLFLITPNCQTNTTISATNVPIAASDEANLGIKMAFKIKSTIAPAISEYSTCFSNPNGTSI